MTATSPLLASRAARPPQTLSSIVLLNASSVAPPEQDLVILSFTVQLSKRSTQATSAAFYERFAVEPAGSDARIT